MAHIFFGIFHPLSFELNLFFDQSFPLIKNAKKMPCYVIFKKLTYW